MQKQTKTKTTEIQTTATIDTTITIRRTDTITVAISRTTDTIIITKHQISNKTETTQINNHVGTATEQTTSPGIVKLVLIAEDWDTCLANVEHHDKIKTIGSKIRMLTKIREIIIKTAMQTPYSNKIL